MAITLHTLAIKPLIRTLKNATAFLAKGEAHAQAAGTNPQEYLDASLHPDMKGLIFQVQRFTDAAKAIAPRINASIPELPLADTETTFAELYERIGKTLEYLESIAPADLEGREDDEIVLQVGPPGRKVEVRFSAVDYVQYYAHANVSFHVTTAYGILRSKGVDVGKMDFLNGAGLVSLTPVAA